MDDRIKHIQSFTGGMNTDLSPKLMPSDTVLYMLNCHVFSSAEGNMGVVSNIRGNIKIEFPLPDGTNKTIGWAADEERSNLYFFIYNSLGYHGIYRYNAVDNAVIPVLVSRIDTDDIDIFKWREEDLILHANVIGNNLLYWCVRGNVRHPARKINISKAMDSSESGYGSTILEEWTRAYKRTSDYAPRAEYFTDPDKGYNRLYGRLFKFAQRFIYDDGEISNWSDWSRVPTPDLEAFAGESSVPNENNGLRILLESGGRLVERIEVAVQQTNPDGGATPWVSVDVLDKKQLGISDGTTFEYLFFNDGALEPIGDQLKIYRNYSYLPKDPFCQEFTNNALIYSNFHEGFPVVNTDIRHSVRYEDLFVGAEEEDKLNEPQIDYIPIGKDYEYMRKILGMGVGSAYYYIIGKIHIGPDVKRGNIFKVRMFGPGGTNWYYEASAGIGDDSRTIANRLAESFRTNNNFTNRRSYVKPVESEVGGGHSFEFKVYNKRGESYLSVTTDVNPVNYSTLKDQGQSINLIKNGSSTRYAIVYDDEDGRVTAGYGTSANTVKIASVNELGGIKKPIVSFEIHHRPPAWARYWRLVRTEDMVYGSFIQILIQKTVEYETPAGDVYTDLVVGSLFTYQSIHPNTTLRYEFKKGDRVRLIANYDPDLPDSEWVVSPDAKDFEVLAYMPEVVHTINEDVEVNGTATVKVAEAKEDHIGSFIRINGSEREIISVPSVNEYALSDTLSSGDPTNPTRKYPSYEIINSRGVIRIKNDPNNPIEADPDSGSFPLVEVYSPSIGQSSIDEEMFADFGAKFPIINWGTDQAYHGGNVQNQDAAQPAIVEVSDGNVYVRTREFPTSNHPTSPQVIYGLVEDPSYSDFYVSDLSNNGRRFPLDRGDGEVLFDERVRFSNNYIQGTRINGLNDFDNLDRKDYNDKYGAIERIWFEEGRLFVFKHLKDAWAPIYSSIITDNTGVELLAKSDQLLPDKLEYYAWDGGVGGNPESIARLGTQFYHVSPNSMIVARLGGNGVDPVSKMYGLDKTVRDHISTAKKAGAHIYGGADRHNGKYDVSIEQHDNVISDTPFSEAGWEREVDELPSTGVTYTIATHPTHGSLDLTDPSIPVYTPDTGYSGPDTFSYEVFVDGVSQGIRNVCLTVDYVEGPKAWRPVNPVCVLNDGVRTGFKEWTTLEEYDTYHNTVTGVTKPNVPGDPDYVAPVWDATTCEPQVEKLLFTTNNTGVSTILSIWFNQFDGPASEDLFLVSKKSGTIINEQLIPTGGLGPETFDLSDQEVSVYVKGAASLFDNIVQLSLDGVGGGDWGIDAIYPEIFPLLTKLNVSGQGSLTTIDFASNTSLDRLEISRNSITGALDTSMLPNLVALEFYENNITSVSSPTNHPNLIYFNSTGNGAITGALDFTGCPDIQTIYANNCNLTGVNVVGCADLKTLGINNNNNLSQSFDFTSNPELEDFNADNCPLTDVTWSNNNKVKIFNVASNTIPQASIQNGINANKATLEQVYLQSMPQITTALDFDDCPNLKTVWAADLENCVGISWDDSDNIRNINVSGMASLGHTLTITGKTVNAFLWLTGTGISPSNLDDILIYISGLNVPPIQEHPAGPGAIIYGDYGTAIGAITPTIASLSAYNDLISRGYTIIGPVPGS